MKRFLSTALILVLILGCFAGCGGGSGSNPAPAAPSSQADAPAASEAPPTEGTGNVEKTMKIGVSEMFAHPFFETITIGIKDVVEPLGYEVVSMVGEFDVQKQIADTEDFVAQKFDAIFISPFDSAGIRPALEVAKKAGIPVICVDAPALDIDLIEANVATDNYDAGVQNALRLIEDLNGKGKIVILDSPQATSSLLRANGFVDTIKEKAPDIEIVAQQDYAAEQDKALSIMDNIIQGQPQIDAVYACNENGAFGAISALESANRMEGVKIYTIDGSQDGVDMIKAGKITGIAAQQPYLIGKTAAESMLVVLEGGTIEKEVAVPAIFVATENADTYVGY